MHVDLAAAVAAVEPDLVAGVPGRRLEEVARREVLHADAVHLVHEDPVATHGVTVLTRPQLLVVLRGRALRSSRLRAIHDHCVAIHAAQVKARRADEDPRREVGHRALKPTLVAQFGAQTYDEIERQPRSTESFIGKQTILAMRIDHRHSRGQLFRHLMMINDDHVEIELPRGRHFPGIGDTAIDRH